ncbi:MAG: GatB/YqeY domain-containing protein [Eubacteriales bacterium]|nr:GatB/YqeY domain-containing protein [Eubacteriales bacterium]
MVTVLDLKKAKMQALKNKDENGKVILGVAIAAYQKAEVEKRSKGQEMSDADMVSVLSKVIKECEDEKKMYVDAGREEDAKNSEAQIAILKAYLPQQMSEEEIRKVIDSLPDKSIKNVMVTFKTQYAGKADMGLVNKVAREFQGR